MCILLVYVVEFEEELDMDIVCHQLCSAGAMNMVSRKLLKGLESSKLEDK